MKFIIPAFFVLLFLIPGPVAAQTACPAGTVCLENPLGFIGDTPTKIILKATEGFAIIMGAVAVAFLVFSGFKLILATNEEAIRSAKQSITWSVGGFVLATLAFTIISGTAALFGFRQISAPGDTLNSGGFLNLGNPASSRDFEYVMNFVMNGILALVGVVAVIMIIYYGFRYMTSAGSEEAIETSKTGLKWSIVGLVLIMLAFVIIAGVQRILFSIR